MAGRGVLPDQKSLNRRPSMSGSFLGPLRSIPFLLLRPKLLLLAVIPPIINFGIFILLFSTLSMAVTMPTVDRVREAIPYLGEGIAFLVSWFLTFVFLVVCLLLMLILVTPLAAPFLDALSIRIEREILHDRPDLIPEEPPLLESILHALKEAMRRLSILLFFVSLTFLISLTPVIGPMIAALLAYIQAALFLSVDAFSYSLDRRRWKFSEKLRLLRRNPRLWLPLGGMQALLVLIPCSFFFLPTLGAVAGTRLYCRHVRLDPQRYGVAPRP